MKDREILDKFLNNFKELSDCSLNFSEALPLMSHGIRFTHSELPLKWVTYIPYQYSFVGCCEEGTFKLFTFEELEEFMDVEDLNVTTEWRCL